MSLDASLWAWKAPVKSSTQRLVLVSLADRAGEDHSCYPSARRLEQDTLLNRKTILKAVADLIAIGLVTDTGRRVGNGVRVLQLVGVIGREGIPNLTHPKIGTGTKNGTSTHPKNGTSTHPKIGIQNLSIESTNESTNIYKFSFASELKKLGGNEQLINDWMLVRKSKKAKDTKTAFEGFCREYKKSGLDINEVIRICAERNWQGFDASWLKNKTSNQQPTRNVNQAWSNQPHHAPAVDNVDLGDME